MQKKFEDMTLSERFAHMRPIWRREDTCLKLANQVMELNNRGLLQAGGTLQVGEFTAHLSADRWDTSITRGAQTLMNRVPMVDNFARVISVQNDLSDAGNWTQQWNAAYKKTLAQKPMGAGYHALRALRKVFA